MDVCPVQEPSLVVSVNVLDKLWFRGTTRENSNMYESTQTAQSQPWVALGFVRPRVKKTGSRSVFPTLRGTSGCKHQNKAKTCLTLQYFFFKV